MTIDGDTLGAWLKTERERRGVTLDGAADATKINRSLLAALERNDLSQWPKGIFRRAFIREYAKAIGLSPDWVAAEFTRAFPDDGRSAPEPPPARGDDGGLRLTLMARPQPTATAIAVAILMAIIDAGIVLLTGRILASLFGVPFWTIAATAALVYYPAALLYLGQVPASWGLACLRSTLSSRRLAQRPQTDTDNREPLRVVSRRPAAPVSRAGVSVWRQPRFRAR